MATPSDFDALRPVLFVSGDSSCSVIYSPGGPEYHQHRTALEAHGVEGSGYDFSGALRAALTDQSPATLDAVGFDPEGGMVSVYGNDLDALLIAARTLHTLVLNADALDAALARSIELGLDD